MADKSTFIKLDRNIQDWRWYDNANTFRVFIHILLNANVKKNGFEGIDVERGQLVTSYASIAKKLKISVQEARTAINHLKSTGELTVKIYPKFSLISVVNYNSYQDISTRSSTSSQQAANNQPTSNQQQYKNRKNERMKEVDTPSLFEISSFIFENKLNVDAEKFFNHYTDNGWTTKSGKPVTDWKAVLICWSEKEKETYAGGYANVKKLSND